MEKNDTGSINLITNTIKPTLIEKEVDCEH